MGENGCAIGILDESSDARMDSYMGSGHESDLASRDRGYRRGADDSWANGYSDSSEHAMLGEADGGSYSET